MRSEQFIKAIFFDLGGVVFLKDRMYARVLEVYQPSDPISFWKVYNTEAMPFCRGEIDKHHFLRNLAANTGREVSDERIDELCEQRFHENRVVDADVLSTIKALRRNYRLGLISNITEDFAELARQMGVFSLFDEVFLSYKLGLSKDNERIFRIALDTLRVAPAEAVFIDDYELYVEVARSVGMRGILFENNPSLCNDLVAMGVAV